MGFGFGRCGFDRCDCCVGGYGDGPCGGYYSYWDRYRCAPFRGLSKGCCRGSFTGSGNRGHGCGFPGLGINNFCCSPGWRNPCGGFFFNIPCGCANLGLFMPF